MQGRAHQRSAGFGLCRRPRQGFGHDWASYGSGLLGLQRIDKSRSTLAFRMDDRKQRILVDADGGEGIGFFGWEVADAAALDALAARLENERINVAHGARARLPTSGT